MDTAKDATRSKVIVQYTDPAGLFEQFHPLIETHLPLGNLHWKSPSRPLRSINALDISFVKEESQTTTSSSNIRRHQIPGLRQTPFVKLLLVRCDDKETYKEKVRKDVKQWVKDNSSASASKGSTKGQERHDASEHLIVHVVLPGTSAATQLRSAKQLPADATDSTDSLNNKSKWTGKSPSTVYDKLRADFHGSSKSSIERVAQIRVPDSNGSIPPLTSKDNTELWNDLIDKLKAAILQSFDTRVAQYEDDIQEREKQRSWPGWNFCTFFILKEGLAKGFENMGLLDDALAIYDELDTGLDLIIHDQASNGGVDTTAALLPFSKDLKDTLRQVLDGNGDFTNNEERTRSDTSISEWVDIEKSNFPLRLERRDYQEMILRNEVSALDFRIYIFIRQTQIMLQRSRVFLSSKLNKKSKGLKYDASLLANICEKSVTFINFASRALRQDLYAAWGGQTGLTDEESMSQSSVISSIIASWIWSAALQILFDCQVIQAITDTARSDTTTIPNHHAGHELRSATSTGHSEGGNENLQPDSIDENAIVEQKTSIPLLFATVATINLSGRIESWAFWVGEVLNLLRTVIAPAKQSSQSALSFQSDKDETAPVEDDTGSLRRARNVLSPSLSLVKRSHQSRYHAYKLITGYVSECCIAAGRTRASRQSLMTLAEMDEQDGNLEAAVSRLDSIPSLLDHEVRTSMDASVLNMYGRLLKTLGRSRDYARYLILSLRSLQWVRNDLHKASSLFEELLTVTTAVDNMQMDFNGIFEVEDIDRFVTHQDLHGGFALYMKLKLKFPAEVQIEVDVSLTLQASGSSSPGSLHMTYKGLACFGKEGKPLFLTCPVATTGWYEVQKVEVRIGKLLFAQRITGMSSNGSNELDLSDSRDSVPVYVFPSSGTPSLTSNHYPNVDMTARRSILLEIDSQKIDFVQAIIRIKPATAGLRLDIQSCQDADDGLQSGLEWIRIGDSQAVQTTGLSQGQKRHLQIPYSLDNSGAMSVDLRCELTYITEDGSFDLHEFLNVDITLPLNVKAQDIFREECIFLRFTISPAILVPVSVTECRVDSDDKKCKVIPGGVLSQAVDIYSKQDCSWIVKAIPQLQFYDATTPLKLQLRLKCYRIDEVILHVVQSIFATALIQSKYNYASKLLVKHLISKIPNLWTEDDLEAAGLARELQLWNFHEVEWKPVLLAFERKDRVAITRWLEEWHDEHRVVNISIDDTTPFRQLRLPVDVIPPTSRITTSLQPRTSVGQFYAIGEVIVADLKIDSDHSSANETEISYEMIGQTDTWLVGGRRRATFMNTNMHTVVLLVAQRTGLLILPSIELRCRRMRNGVTEEVRADVEHLSQTRTIKVIPSVRSTTVGLGHEDPSSDHWMVSSEKIE